MFKKTREKSPYFLVAVDFGYTLLAATVIFGGLGLWLDNRYLTRPLFTIGGIFLGLAVGFNSLFKRLGFLEQSRKAARKKKPEPPKPQP
ncbi:MAG TPA: AtpZ/AtpI family protein [Symbiobacteriaceae bacterium]